MQDRLVKELRLLGISTLEEANNYLPTYIAEHNDLFSITAATPNSKYRTVTEEELDHSFRYKESRKLSKNLEISYNGRIFQIEADRSAYFLRGTEVLVEEDLSGHISVSHQGKELRYKELLVRDRQGRIRNKKEILLANIG